MSQTNSAQRIAEEAQLLAEERWIKEALAKIRNQRNCLQIERLHLESMKGQLKIDSEKAQKESISKNSPSPLSQLQRTICDNMEFEEHIIDEGCNEELNLDVNTHGYGNLKDSDPLNIEEEEDEDMEEEDLLIDMNMFMNAKPVKWD